MVSGGTDLIFICPGKVDVLDTVLLHFRKKWPNLVYESDCRMGSDLKEFFLYADSDVKEKIEEVGVEDDLAPHFVHLLFRPIGQTVRHYIQEVTIVVDKLDQSIFPVIEIIQRDFLRGYMD